MRVLVIGCGECGGNLAGELARPTVISKGIFGNNMIYPVFPIIINTTRLDMWKMDPTKIPEAHWINVDESRVVRGLEKGETILGGCGARRERGIQIYQKNESKIMQEIWDIIPNPDGEPPNMLLLTTSLGGGTGSSFTPLLAKSVAKLFRDRAGITIPISIFGVLPLDPPKEKLDFTRNAVESIGTLFDVGVVSGIFILDNEQWTNGGDIIDEYARINAFAVSQIRPLFEPLGKYSISGQSFDAEDLKSHMIIDEGIPGICRVGTTVVKDERFDEAINRVMDNIDRLIVIGKEARFYSGLILVRTHKSLSLREKRFLLEQQTWFQNHSLSGRFETFYHPHPAGNVDVTILLSYPLTYVERLVKLFEGYPHPPTEEIKEKIKKETDELLKKRHL